MVGMIAGGEENDTEEYKTSAISGKINLDMKAIEWGRKELCKMPVYRHFRDNNGNDRKAGSIDDQF